MKRTAVCKLCLQVKVLQKSHLVPAAGYAHCLENSRPNENPILTAFDPDTQTYNILETSEQIQDYLLCRDCERLLNQRGENWVLARLASEGFSPLYEAISRQRPFLDGDDVKVYASAGLPEFNKEQIVHFAIGVFFKAGVHRWRIGKQRKGVSLGKYSEELRKYLLGLAGFPERCTLWFNIIPPTFPLIALCPPYQLDITECHTFSFCIGGLEFVMSLGKQIPELHKQICFVRAAAQPILVSGHTAVLMSGKTKEAFAKGMVVGKLRARLN